MPNPNVIRFPPELCDRIYRIRMRYFQIEHLRSETGATVPPELVNQQFIDAPEVVALFDEYGEDTVRAAVDRFQTLFAQNLSENIK